MIALGRNGYGKHLPPQASRAGGRRGAARTATIRGLGTCREGEKLRSRLSYWRSDALLLALWDSPLVLDLLLVFRRDRRALPTWGGDAGWALPLAGSRRL